MKLTVVCVLLLCAGCVVPPELSEARADVARLEAKMLQNEATLLEAQEGLSNRSEELKSLRAEVLALKTIQAAPGIPDDQAAILAVRIREMEDRIHRSEQNLSTEREKIDTYASMAGDSRAALDIAREVESKWQVVADNLTNAKVARYAEAGVKLGDSIFGSLIPWLQTILPGLGGLGVAAGVWETIRRKRAANGTK